eukprot:gene3534-8314_t
MIIVEVIHKVFVGDYAAFQNHAHLKELNVSAIISVIAEDTKTLLPDFIRFFKHVPITDEDRSDLLSFLPGCIDFIDNANFKVVRTTLKLDIPLLSQAGMSRSVAVALAYVMYKEGTSPGTAYRSLKKVHRKARPNDGFVEQLKLFAAMGYKMDSENSDYRLYRLSHFADERAVGEEVPPDVLAPDPISLPVHAEGSCIRCKKCRRILLQDRNLLSHVPSIGQLSFSHRRRDATLSESVCSSHFCEPMVWMNEVSDGAVEGKIQCPKCQYRLGTFNWSGVQCSCGAWITPAFQIHKGRVDISRLRPAQLLMSIPVQRSANT